MLFILKKKHLELRNINILYLFLNLFNHIMDLIGFQVFFYLFILNLFSKKFNLLLFLL